MAVSKVNLVVLGMLSQNPMHGYKIMQRVEDMRLHLWAGVKMPSVYKGLHRLEKRGYIVGEQVVEGNNPPRSVYTLTEKGEKYFRKILKEYLQSDEHVGFNFWMAVRFVKGMVTREFFLEVMEQRREFVQKFMDSHGDLKEKIEEEYGVLPFYGKIMIESGRRHHQIELETLNKMIQKAKLPENEHIFLSEEDA